VCQSRLVKKICRVDGGAALLALPALLLPTPTAAAAALAVGAAVTAAAVLTTTPLHAAGYKQHEPGQHVADTAEIERVVVALVAADAAAGPEQVFAALPLNADLKGRCCGCRCASCAGPAYAEPRLSVHRAQEWMVPQMLGSLVDCSRIS
jgi:hypothetical protein